MIRVARPYADPVLVSGICLSVALALALGLLGPASPVESLLVGLMGITATLVLEASARAERRFRLRDLIEATDWLPGAVLSVATATRQIAEQHPAPEVVAEARRRLHRLTEEFDELALGSDRAGRPGLRAAPRRHEGVPPPAAGGHHHPGRVGSVALVAQRHRAALLGGESGRAEPGRGHHPGVRVRPGGPRRGRADRGAARGRGAHAGGRAGRGGPGARRSTSGVWEGRRGCEDRTNDGGEVEHVFTVNERDVRGLLDTFTACERAARPTP